MTAPYAPTAGKLARFWIAGPLTCLIFVPVLFSGVFGAPMMIPGMIFAWRHLRHGQDDYATFALGGGICGLIALILAIPFEAGALFAFGLVFGPMMAMTFRAIAGQWRPE